MVVIALVALVITVTSQPANGPATQSSNPSPSDTPSGLPSATASASPDTSATPSPDPTPPFNMTEHSINDADSIWVVVNKQRALDPQDYEPDDLMRPDVTNINDQPMREQVADAVVTMFDAAADDGVDLTVQSAYRSYDRQVSVYERYVNELGQDAADLTSARPGHSEHQTGLAVDISGVSGECSLAPCFGDTIYGEWLAAHAWKFGFIVRYPDGGTPITGYEYEPYHMRYVGEDLARQMHDTETPTLEEFFGLPAAPDYG